MCSASDCIRLGRKGQIEETKHWVSKQPRKAYRASMHPVLSSAYGPATTSFITRIETWAKQLREERAYFSLQSGDENGFYIWGHRHEAACLLSED